MGRAWCRRRGGRPCGSRLEGTGLRRSGGHRWRLGWSRGLCGRGCLRRGWGRYLQINSDAGFCVGVLCGFHIQAERDPPGREFADIPFINFIGGVEWGVTLDKDFPIHRIIPKPIFQEAYSKIMLLGRKTFSMYQSGRMRRCAEHYRFCLTGKYIFR